jgi:hypothetical protein
MRNTLSDKRSRKHTG